ncbi:respiratory nitrate reductase subunit gamma [Gracilibacillus sp. S3-1-1]|uniref:Respiratory nitrate reductase subunit gamma n=1 Tax=Gracilibacillus pellucidus TaxID=3095368 RepID=A0ACC6M4E9_9BACI|nr:respiratory nitrate reductase subunit gamma [Gracilibacillus sp. S3-1-1]MDX8045840.1 respiratory nitrate reductase subunit gamma [Gracilibacillus sp. S3-1-1]
MIDQFLWLIFPYLCLASFIIGHIYRYKHDQFTWTAKSSEFIEKKQLVIGSLLFHIGVIPVAFGHVAGLGIPKEWMRTIGVNDHLYHIGAVYIGGLFGVLTLLGMLMLTARRVTKRSVRKLSSSSDIAVNVLLLLIICLGVYSTLVTNTIQHDFDYRETISVWFRDLLIFRPDVSYMSSVPLSFKLHMLLGFLIIGLWPYTRLVHVWSVPLSYVGRSYILYRRHKHR